MPSIRIDFYSTTDDTNRIAAQRFLKVCTHSQRCTTEAAESRSPAKISEPSNGTASTNTPSAKRYTKVLILYFFMHLRVLSVFVVVVVALFDCGHSSRCGEQSGPALSRRLILAPTPFLHTFAEPPHGVHVGANNQQVVRKYGLDPVSYTHLTLPTN